MTESRLHLLAARGQSVWFDTLSRELVRSGELKRMMEADAVTGVTSNPTIFQKALAHGDAYDEGFRERSPRGRRRGDLLQAGARGHPRGLRCAAAGLGGLGRRRRLRLDGGRSAAGVRHRGDVRAGEVDPRAGRPAEPDGEDPGDPARPAGDRGQHRARQVDQHHADLLARALPRRRRGLPARSRAARRLRRRPVQARVGRVVLRLARRHRGRQAPRGARRRGLGASWRSRTRGSPTSTRSWRSRARAGTTSPARARACSGACGRRRRRRTRPTATCSTSRS